jgi:hypothetical protein
MLLERRLVAGLLAATLATLAAGAAPLGIMVPAYFYPGSGGGLWNALNTAAPRVPLVAIMNPGSGPGTSQDSNYVQALARLHQAGGKVTGYVHTSYAARPLADAESDVDLYLSFYAVDGFFIDEMTSDSDTNHLNYYAALYQYIKAKGPNYSVTGNPGTSTPEDYLTKPTADTLMTFEDNGTNYPGFTPPSWVTNHPASQFVHLPYAVTTAAIMSNFVGLAVSRNAGWVYITDDTLPNPYDTLPAYWTNEVSLVQTFSGSNQPVTIITQPTNQTAAAGRSVTFSVQADGSAPLSYQWFSGTNAIPSATNAAYVIASVQPANAGTYYVRITNSISSTNSRTASLMVTTNTSTYRHVMIDGSFNDWAGVPLAYSAPPGPAGAIQYQDVYLANDETNLYMRVTLYSPRTNAFANSWDNLFVDADVSAATGYPVAGIGSEMLVQWGNGYQEKNGGFNEGAVTNLGWAIARSPDGLSFELAISRHAAYATNNGQVFANSTIALLLEGDDTNWNSVEFVPPSDGLLYTFASRPTALGPLSISYSGGSVVVSWAGSGTLQLSDSLSGAATWSNFPAATSPYTTAASSRQQFFRLVQ